MGSSCRKRKMSYIKHQISSKSVHLLSNRHNFTIMPLLYLLRTKYGWSGSWYSRVESHSFRITDSCAGYSQWGIPDLHHSLVTLSDFPVFILTSIPLSSKTEILPYGCYFKTGTHSSLFSREVNTRTWRFKIYLQITSWIGIQIKATLLTSLNVLKPFLISRISYIQIY
jgi:hypothetical protein